ncbi:MAG: amino acid ABC transporter substrate-binding protein, partial [Dehalococcoidia bacterium]|nr:amino acid ABC transporter substrate-binding protein [Dehalococcoidia bacterium]
DAIERAGTLDGEKVNAALAATDLMTVRHRVKFEANHFSRGPLVFGQWQKTNNPWVWECPVVFSKHDFIKATTSPIFPIPYK